VLFFARKGQENLCDDLLFLNGAYAESVVVPARLSKKICCGSTPLRPSGRCACRTLACVLQGVEDARLRKGQRVLIIGAGPIGLMFTAVARTTGCDVWVAGRGEARLRPPGGWAPAG